MRGRAGKGGGHREGWLAFDPIRHAGTAPLPGERDVGGALAGMSRYAATAIRLVGSMTLEELQADVPS